MHFSDINLLSVLGKSEFSSLRSSFRTRRHAKKSIMYYPYDDASDDVVFVVISGRVRVYLAHEEKEFTLAILEAGDVYSSHTRAFVEALDDTEIYVGDVAAFQRGLTDVPAFAQTMVRVLARMLSSSFDAIESLAFKDAEKRLAELLFIEAERVGVEEAGGVRFALGLTTEQLSHLVGATRQTVSTLLNDFIRDGLLIKEGRDSYLVPDMGLLRKRVYEA